MPTVSVDQHTLLIDGRRIWMTAGVVSCVGVPQQEWRKRLTQAKRLGINTIVAPAVWAEHEPIKGKFDFKGERAFGSFIRAAGELGLHVVVRVGPQVDETLDLGGMPSWLMGDIGVGEALRAAGPGFMSACNAWFAALAKELAPLQATRGRSGSAHPIIAVQLEHRWLVGDAVQAEAYLGGLARLLRERGIDVPVLNVNNLFATAEGQVECWSGSKDLHSVARQLGAALPDQPRVMADIGGDEASIWRVTENDADDESLAHAVASALGGGAQCVIARMARGMRFGFTGGRDERSAGVFIAPGNPADLLNEAGELNPAASEVRRLLTFSSTFWRLFASADPQYEPVTIAPAIAPAAGSGKRGASVALPAPTVLNRRGPQGAVSFVFNHSGHPVHLCLENGQQIEVTSHPTGLSWIVRHAHLHGRHRLDLCTFSTFATLGSVLVCFAPEKTQGQIVINGTTASLAAPNERAPHVETLEGVTIVLCNNQQIDNSVLLDDRFIIGTTDVDATGELRSSEGVCMIVHVDGRVETHKAMPAASTAIRAPTVRMDGRVSLSAYADGTSERFVRIDGPAPLAQLGTASGYAWLRVDLTSSSARKVKFACFDVADRAMLFIDGAPGACLGVGPGADGCIGALPLRKGKNRIVALMDNLGRSPAEGIARRFKGLGHLEEVAPFKAGAPKIEVRRPVELLGAGRLALHLHTGDATDPHRLVWTFAHRRKTALAFVLEQPPSSGALLVNDEVVFIFDPALPLRARLTSEVLKQGKNTIEVALLGGAEAIEHGLAQVRAGAALYEIKASLTESAAWAEATWTPPEDSEFTSPEGEISRAPAWWRLTFDTPKHEGKPLWFEPTGLSKGQLFLNGRNLCRYFVSTREGTAVHGQARYWLPGPWLREAGKANELLVFDECGRSASKARVRFS